MLSGWQALQDHFCNYYHNLVQHTCLCVARVGWIVVMAVSHLPRSVIIVFVSQLAIFNDPTPDSRLESRNISRLSWREIKRGKLPPRDHLFSCLPLRWHEQMFILQTGRTEKRSPVPPRNLWCHASEQRNSAGNQLEKLGENTLILSRMAFF